MRLAAVVSRWAARAGGAVIALCVLLVAAEVALRNLFNLAVLHSFELSVYGFAAAVAFGFAYTLTERAHIRIDVLYARLPLAARALADVAAMIAMTGLAAVMAWRAWDVVAASARLGAVSNTTLQLPLVIPQGLWACGLSWFALVALLLAAQTLCYLLTGRLDELHGFAGVRAPGVRAPGVDNPGH